MADSRISQLTASGAIASGDLIPIVDISDTTDSAEGTTRKITKANLVKDITLTTDVTGTLPVANGGTGVTSSTGTVAVVLSTSPTLVTPDIGVATATSVNKIAITAPATSATLTIADGQTLTVNGSATITNGTHSGTNTGDNTVATALTGTPSITVATVTTTGNIELGHASDTTIARSGAGAITVEGVDVLLSGGALGTPASGTLTNATGLPVAGIAASTSTALGVGSIELGHATDTSITRVSAGVAAIEGVNVLTVAGGTLTGNITLGENTSVVLDAAGSADEKWSGITIPGTAGATLAVGDLCYLDVTATEWLLADADAATTAGSVVLGICVQASTDGAATTMLLNGTIRSAAFPASIALGAPVYVDVTAGDISATQPSGVDDVIRVVGWAVTVEPNTIYFNPEPGYITHT